MSLESIIREALVNDSGVSAIAGDRVYEDYQDIPQDPDFTVQAFIAFQLEGKEQEDSLPTTNGLYFDSRYSFQCVSEDSEMKTNLASAVETALYALRGDQPSLSIMESRLDNMRDEWSEASAERNLRIRTLYWRFIWRRS